MTSNGKIVCDNTTTTTTTTTITSTTNTTNNNNQKKKTAASHENRRAKLDLLIHQHLNSWSEKCLKRCNQLMQLLFKADKNKTNINSDHSSSELMKNNVNHSHELINSVDVKEFIKTNATMADYQFLPAKEINYRLSVLKGRIQIALQKWIIKVMSQCLLPIVVKHVDSGPLIQLMNSNFEYVFVPPKINPLKKKEKKEKKQTPLTQLTSSSSSSSSINENVNVEDIDCGDNEDALQTHRDGKGDIDEETEEDRAFIAPENDDDDQQDNDEEADQDFIPPKKDKKDHEQLQSKSKSKHQKKRKQKHNDKNNKNDPQKETDTDHISNNNNNAENKEQTQTEAEADSVSMEPPIKKRRKIIIEED
jgi:hypothetical protein